MRAVFFVCVVILVSLVSAGPAAYSHQMALQSGSIQEVQKDQFDGAEPTHAHQKALQNGMKRKFVNMKHGDRYRSRGRRAMRDWGKSCEDVRKKAHPRNIDFQLYTSENESTRLTAEDINSVLNMTDLDLSLPMVVVIHGFREDADQKGRWMHDIKDEWMKKKSLNVILVNWGLLAGGLPTNYKTASCGVKFVGQHLAELIKLLQDQGLSLSKTHIIGFSLGAHIAGEAGKKLEDLSRITGLDPAGPKFHGNATEDRLDKTDAIFVDVIHTNIGDTHCGWFTNIGSGRFGYDGDLGHVDFYMNGGKKQPGCEKLSIGCSHRRAYEYYYNCLKSSSCNCSFLCEDYENKEPDLSGPYDVNPIDFFLTKLETKPIGPEITCRKTLILGSTTTLAIICLIIIIIVCYRKQLHMIYKRCIERNQGQ